MRMNRIFCSKIEIWTNQDEETFTCSILGWFVPAWVNKTGSIIIMRTAYRDINTSLLVILGNTPKIIIALYWVALYFVLLATQRNHGSFFGLLRELPIDRWYEQFRSRRLKWNGFLGLRACQAGSKVSNASLKDVLFTGPISALLVGKRRTETPLGKSTRWSK